MVTTIRKGASKKEIQDLFKEVENKKKSRRGFDAYKFCGTIKFDEDALKIQKKMRNEWE
jgi:hypothetical protein